MVPFKPPEVRSMGKKRIQSTIMSRRKQHEAHGFSNIWGLIVFRMFFLLGQRECQFRPGGSSLDLSPSFCWHCKESRQRYSRSVCVALPLESSTKSSYHNMSYAFFCLQWQWYLKLPQGFFLTISFKVVFSFGRIFFRRWDASQQASSPERTPGRSPEGHVTFLVQEAWVKNEPRLDFAVKNWLSSKCCFGKKKNISCCSVVCTSTICCQDVTE